MSYQITRRVLARALSVAFAAALTFGAGMADAQMVQVHRGIVETDPASFNGRSPQHHDVHGIDVARFQGPIDWQQVRSAGVSFAFIKATEGGDLLDPLFADHWSGAKQAGIERGAYHFYYFCTPPEVQATWFIRNVPKARGDLPPVLDMEWNPQSPTCQRRPPAAAVRQEMATFMQMVGQHYGRRPVIYTTPQFYRENQLNKMGNEAFWLRSTAKSPEDAFPGQNWHFWQHSATGRIPGIKKHVDLNVFVGDANQWKTWVRKSAVR